MVLKVALFVFSSTFALELPAEFRKMKCHKGYRGSLRLGVVVDHHFEKVIKEADGYSDGQSVKEYVHELVRNASLVLQAQFGIGVTVYDIVRESGWSCVKVAKKGDNSEENNGNAHIILDRLINETGRWVTSKKSGEAAAWLRLSGCRSTEDLCAETENGKSCSSSGTIGLATIDGMGSSGTWWPGDGKALRCLALSVSGCSFRSFLHELGHALSFDIHHSRSTGIMIASTSAKIRADPQNLQFNKAVEDKMCNAIEILLDKNKQSMVPNQEKTFMPYKQLWCSNCKAKKPKKPKPASKPKTNKGSSEWYVALIVVIVVLSIALVVACLYSYRPRTPDGLMNWLILTKPGTAEKQPLVYQLQKNQGHVHQRSTRELIAQKKVKMLGTTQLGQLQQKSPVRRKLPPKTGDISMSTPKKKI